MILGTLSSSVDNLSPKQRATALRKPEVKPVMPPFVGGKINTANDSWQIDNGWKFMSKLKTKK